MKIIVNHEKKFVFILNGKCASTTLKHLFLDSCKIPIKKQINMRNTLNPYSIPTDELCKLANLRYPVYYFVRNPFSRIVSCYINKFIISKELDKRPFYQRLKYAGLSSFNISFKDFVLFLLKKGADFTIDGHVDPLVKGNLLENKIIVKIENLDNFVNQFVNDYNIPNSRNFKYRYNKISCENITIQGAYDLKPEQFTSIPKYASFYNNDLIKQVALIYKKDLQELGYTYPYI